MKKLYIKPEFDPCELETEIIAGSVNSPANSPLNGIDGDNLLGKERDDFGDDTEEW